MAASEDLSALYAPEDRGIFQAFDELFRLVSIKEQAGEFCIIVLKIGSVHVDDCRPHELTPWDEAILSEPSRFIFGYSGQAVNLFILACDSEYATKRTEKIGNDDRFVWQEEERHRLDSPRHHTCVIPQDVRDYQIRDLFARFDASHRLCVGVLNNFTGAFANLEIDNPSVIADLPSNCFADVSDSVFKPALRFNEGNLRPFAIIDSADGRKFVNSEHAQAVHFDMVSSMCRYFLYRNTRELVGLRSVLKWWINTQQQKPDASSLERVDTVAFRLPDHHGLSRKLLAEWKFFVETSDGFPDLEEFIRSVMTRIFGDFQAITQFQFEYGRLLDISRLGSLREMLEVLNVFCSQIDFKTVQSDGEDGLKYANYYLLQ